MAKRTPLFLLPLLFSSVAWSTNQPQINQTQFKLKELNQRIQTLTQKLGSAGDKRTLLHNELAETEKQMGHTVEQLRQMQLRMNQQQQSINHLEEEIAEINQQLENQHSQLARHVLSRYQMGEYQPLKWLLLQQDPKEFSRLLTYYQYLVRARQQLIDDIEANKSKLTASQDQLKQQLTQQKQMQYQLSVHQHELQQQKQYHVSVLENLDKEIQSQQSRLQEFQRDKDNLTRLLQSLKEQHFVQPSKPFAQMRRKLPPPIAYQRGALQKMNQGVTFFADEGTLVKAIYPGKVVFSDWLKGYGLLLIIDHGQGFMTLYAHNQSLFKRKGDLVHQNEQIATVGHTGGIRQNGLYFEVRVRGKAVSPLDWVS